MGSLVDELDARGGLVLAGYLLAGQPPGLVEIYLRPGRSSDERRRLVLTLNGRQVDKVSSTSRAGLRGFSSTLADSR